MQVTELGSSFTEPGLYGCYFSSYEEMISLIRSFPLCDSLFLCDCVTPWKCAAGNVFAGLLEHRLSIKGIQLSSSFRLGGQLIDVSTLIEDASLDVESLTAWACDVRTSERTRHIAAAVSGSPVEQFQISCAEPGGYQGGRISLGSEL